MSAVTPFVRHMLVCDDARPNPADPRKVVVYNLVSEIRATGGAAGYPLNHSFAVYIAVTEGRGTGEGRIAVTSADTGKECYLGQPHPIVFGNDPLKVYGLIFHITTCTFPQPGFYWVEMRYNGTAIAREPLLLR
jgi:hypothetical protein